MYAVGTILEKPTLIYKHVGVCLNDRYVLQNVPFRGEEIVTLANFVGTSSITTIHPDMFDQLAFHRRVAEIRKNPQSYNMFFRNCEHTIYWALTGVASSPQLENYMKFAIGVAVVTLIVRA